MTMQCSWQWGRTLRNQHQAVCRPWQNETRPLDLTVAASAGGTPRRRNSFNERTVQCTPGAGARAGNSRSYGVFLNPGWDTLSPPGNERRRSGPRESRDSARGGGRARRGLPETCNDSADALGAGIPSKTRSNPDGRDRPAPRRLYEVVTLQGVGVGS